MSVLFDNLGKGERIRRCALDGTRRALRERVRGGAGLRGEAAEQEAVIGAITCAGCGKKERWKIWSSEKGFMVDA